MDEILTCKNCNKGYDTERRLPHDLTCHHVLCTLCLNDLLSSEKKCKECQTEVDYSETNLVPLSYATVRLVRFKELATSGKCDTSDHPCPRREPMGNIKQDAKAPHGTKVKLQARTVVGKRLKGVKNKHSKRETKAKKNASESSESVNAGTSGVDETSNSATPLTDETKATNSKEHNEIPYVVNGGTCSNHSHPIIGFCQTCYLTACKDCLVTKHFKSTAANKKCIVGSIQTMLTLFINSSWEMLAINCETVVQLSLRIQGIELFTYKKMSAIKQKMDSQETNRHFLQKELEKLKHYSYVVKDKEREMSVLHAVMQYYKQSLSTLHFTEDLLTDVNEVTSSIESLRPKIDKQVAFAAKFSSENPDFVFSALRIESGEDEDEFESERYIVSLHEVEDSDLAVDKSSTPTEKSAQDKSSTPTEKPAQDKSTTQTEKPGQVKSSTPTEKLVQDDKEEKFQDDDKPKSEGDEYQEALNEVFEYVKWLMSKLLFLPVAGEDTNVKNKKEKDKAEGALRKPLRIPDICKRTLSRPTNLASENIGQASALNTKRLSSEITGQASASNTKKVSSKNNGQVSASNTEKVSPENTGQASAFNIDKLFPQHTGQLPASLPLLTSVMTPSLAFVMADAKIPTRDISPDTIHKFQFQILSLACDNIDRQPVLIAEPDVFEEELCAYKERAAGIEKGEGIYDFDTFIFEENPTTNDKEYLQEQYSKRNENTSKHTVYKDRTSTNPNLCQYESTSKKGGPDDKIISLKSVKPEISTLPDLKQDTKKSETKPKPDEVAGVKPVINSSQEKACQVGETLQPPKASKKVVFKNVPITDPGLKKAYAQAKQLAQSKAIDNGLTPFLANILSTKFTSARELALSSAEAISTNRVPPVLSPTEASTSKESTSPSSTTSASTSTSSLADGRRNRRPVKRVSRSQKLLQEKKREANNN